MAETKIIVVAGESVEDIEMYGQLLLLTHTSQALEDISSQFKERVENSFTRESIVESLDDAVAQLKQKLSEIPLMEVHLKTLSFEKDQEAPDA